MSPAEKIQLGYYLCAALGIFFGMIIMAYVRVERGDLEPEDNRDEKTLFDIWEEE